VNELHFSESLNQGFLKSSRCLWFKCKIYLCLFKRRKNEQFFRSL